MRINTWSKTESRMRSMTAKFIDDNGCGRLTMCMSDAEYDLCLHARLYVCMFVSLSICISLSLSLSLSLAVCVSFLSAYQCLYLPPSRASSYVLCIACRSVMTLIESLRQRDNTLHLFLCTHLYLPPPKIVTTYWAPIGLNSVRVIRLWWN